MLTLGSLKAQRGAAMIEHIVLWPMLAILTLGIVQMGLLYRDKATVNHAVFMAAREGAVKNAFLAPMRLKMAEALSPLYMKSDPGPVSYLAAVERSMAQNGINRFSGAELGLVRGIAVEVLSPNRAVFDEFARDMYELPPGCEQQTEKLANGLRRTRCSESRFRQIPNDNLYIRSNQTRRIELQGEETELNLQDANLLKVRGHYCSPLIVPLVNRLFHRVYLMSGANQHPHWQACLRKTAVSRGLGRSEFYIPVSSDSIIRMQSAIRCEADPEKGQASSCGNLT